MLILYAISKEHMNQIVAEQALEGLKATRVTVLANGQYRIEFA